MRTQQKHEIRALEEKRKQLLEDIEHLKEMLTSEVDITEEELDPEIIEHEKTLALIRALENKLQKVEDALAAAKEGTYGICTVCGQPIDPARLRIMPETTVCVTCKAAMERKNGAMRYSQRYQMAA